MPWRIGEIILKNIENIDEYVVQFDQLSLKGSQAIQGFDPKYLLFAHISLFGYVSYFSKYMQFEGGGYNQNLLEASIENTLDYIEELDSTNEYYKQWGRETKNKNLNSPNVS